MTIKSSGHLLRKLRSLMQATSVGPINAYFVSSEDAHQSEYLAECDQRRQFISKFTGSAGIAIITLDKAAVWTDGRYHLQASLELDPENWILMKSGLPDTLSPSEWLKEELKPGSKVGVDPFLMSSRKWTSLSTELKLGNISLIAMKENLIDLIWEDKSVLIDSDSTRPARPCRNLISLSIDMAGKDWTTKVTELRQELTKKKSSAIILTALDEIAWLLNLRGDDIEFNPVFFAYTVVTMKDVYLFIDESKLTPEVRQAINANKAKLPSENSTDPCVKILPYENIVDFISKTLVPSETGLIWVSNDSSEAIVSCIPKEKRFEQQSHVLKQKAIKNETEIRNIKSCHIRDGAALCEYLEWLESMIESNPEGHDQLWEIPGADFLENCRRQQQHFVSLSFPTISSSGPNGAIIHYHPSQSTRRPISKKELYLVDSGAQYLDGTTDVTRTVHFGQPSAKERECFTLVLKGHINLAMAKFPKLVKGISLDSLARRYLWSQGLDYQHGTGHGVGMFLNVHEGPSSISPSLSTDDPGIDAGQILSNEPGYYEDGAFGIRIESLVVTRKVDLPYNFNQRGFLEFETITLVPIQSKMIDLSLLTDEEIGWLNSYHKTCRELVGAHLEKIGKLHVKQWLIKETDELTRAK